MPHMYPLKCGSCLDIKLNTLLGVAQKWRDPFACSLSDMTGQQMRWKGAEKMTGSNFFHWHCEWTQLLHHCVELMQGAKRCFMLDKYSMLLLCGTGVRG